MYSTDSNLLFTQSSWLKKAIMVIFATLILAAASQLSIPLLPVPLTFQSATVILIAMAYGSRLGTTVIATYLCAGIYGMPVFADFSAGPMVFAGPTAGYLFGFLPAAFVAGALAERGFGRHFLSAFITAICAAAIIFACGVPVLARFIGWQHAIALGFTPFIWTELIKLAAVAFIIPRLWQQN